MERARKSDPVICKWCDLPIEPEAMDRMRIRKYHRECVNEKQRQYMTWYNRTAGKEWAQCKTGVRHSKNFLSQKELLERLEALSLEDFSILLRLIWYKLNWKGSRHRKRLTSMNCLPDLAKGEG